MSGKVKVTAFGETRSLPKDDDTFAKLDRMKADGVQFTVAADDSPDAVALPTQTITAEKPRELRDPASESMFSNAAKDIKAAYAPTPAVQAELDKDRAANPDEYGAGPINRMSEAFVGASLPGGSMMKAALGSGGMQLAHEAQGVMDGKPTTLMDAAKRVAGSTALGAGLGATGGAMAGSATTLRGAASPRTASELTELADRYKISNPDNVAASKLLGQTIENNLPARAMGRSNKTYTDQARQNVEATDKTIADIYGRSAADEGAAGVDWHTSLTNAGNAAEDKLKSAVTDADVKLNRGTQKYADRLLNTPGAEPKSPDDLLSSFRKIESEGIKSPAAREVATTMRSDLGDTVNSINPDDIQKFKDALSKRDQLSFVRDAMTPVKKAQPASLSDAALGVFAGLGSGALSGSPTTATVTGLTGAGIGALARHAAPSGLQDFGANALGTAGRTLAQPAVDSKIAEMLRKLLGYDKEDNTNDNNRGSQQ